MNPWGIFLKRCSITVSDILSALWSHIVPCQEKLSHVRLVILVLVSPWKLILMLPNVFYIDPAKAKYIESPVCRGIRIEYEINCLFGKNGILAVHVRLMSFPSRALVGTTFDKSVKAGASHFCFGNQQASFLFTPNPEDKFSEKYKISVNS